MKANYWAIIAAAGKGTRMGSPIPKQYLSLHGQPVIAHTLNRLLQLPHFEKIIVAIHPDDSYWNTLNYHAPKILLAKGTDERYRSVLNSLDVLKEFAKPQDWVLVHDAVRPCVKITDIEKLLTCVNEHPVGGLLGTKITDTVKRVRTKNEVVATLDRNELWSAHSPQMFRYELLYKALQTALTNNTTVTDEASAIELVGLTPLMVEGSKDNIKITHPEDLVLAKLYLNNQTVT